MLGGCEETKAFMGLKEDEYFVCSYANTFEDGGKRRESRAVLINNKGEIVKEFPGGYIDGILTKDGYMVGQENGIISKDETLNLFFPKGDGSYSTGIYETREEQWLIEPGESLAKSWGVGENGRLESFNIGQQMYDRFFKKISSYEEARQCYGEQELRNETDINGITKIVDKEGNTVLTAEEFYEKIDYEGQDLFLLQDGNTYQIYDAEKEKVSCKIQTQEESLSEILLIGSESYLGRFLKQSTDNPEGYESICKFLIGGKEKIINYTDYIGSKIIGNGYSVIVINEDGKEISFIVYKDGSYNKKIDKKVLWADEKYYLSYKNNIFSFYDMKDKLVKDINMSQDHRLSRWLALFSLYPIYSIKDYRNSIFLIKFHK